MNITDWKFNSDHETAMINAMTIRYNSFMRKRKNKLKDTLYDSYRFSYWEVQVYTISFIMFAPSI
jgi:hypothetical protein